MASARPASLAASGEGSSSVASSSRAAAEARGAACLVDSLGIGVYQLTVLVAVGSTFLAESVELGAVQPLNAGISVSFGLELGARAAMPAVHYLGAGFGIGLAGPLSDILGRKVCLVASNAGLILAQAALAVLASERDAGAVLFLRFASGAAIGLGLPAGAVLITESCPRSWRTSMFYCSQFLSNIGFVISAIGIYLFMPHFGEDPKDSWRLFCLFSTVPALVSLPVALIFISETPEFYAARGDVEGCRTALRRMARANGEALAPVSDQELLHRPACTPSTTVWSIYHSVRTCAVLICVLAMMDCARGFMTSGSSYLWPQLFERLHGRQALAPSMLNIITEIAPLLGLALGHQVASIGPHCVAAWCSGIVATALVVLLVPDLRRAPTTLLGVVVTVKLCYGPLGTAIMQMKAESFPAEARATIFALISVFAKVGVAGAPVLVEVLAGDQWHDSSLRRCLQCLIASVLLCFACSTLVPGQSKAAGEAAERRLLAGGSAEYGTTPAKAV